MLSATIIVPSIEVQERLSGDTPSPTLTLAVSSKKNPKKEKGKNINENSLDNNVSLDEIIEMPK